jgi:upstream activation factor subunit UAF30
MFTAEEDDMPKVSKKSSRANQRAGASKERGGRNQSAEGSNGRRANGRGRGGQSPGTQAGGARRSGNGGAAGEGGRGGKRRVNPALAQPVTPDEELSAIVGSKPLPRPQVVKKLWDYIKAEGLQDKQNKRMINADEKLRPVFRGKSKVNMFEMTKLVSEHLQSSRQ